MCLSWVGARMVLTPTQLFPVKCRAIETLLQKCEDVPIVFRPHVNLSVDSGLGYENWPLFFCNTTKQSDTGIPHWHYLRCHMPNHWKISVFFWNCHNILPHRLWLKTTKLHLQSGCLPEGLDCSCWQIEEAEQSGDSASRSGPWHWLMNPMPHAGVFSKPCHI